MELSITKGQDLSGFLTFLFDGLEGYVATATKKQTDTGVEFKRQFFSWPKQVRELTDWINETSPVLDVYIAPALFKNPSGRKEDFHASNVVWSEFDGTLPSDNQMGTIPVPTLKVRSSGLYNEHWYWRLDEPCIDSSILELTNRALTYQLGADASGWDCNQILRPPTTLNHKYEVPALVTLLSINDSTVSPVSLGTLPAYEASNLGESDFSKAIPDIQEVIFKYQWPSEVANFFRSKVEQDSDRSVMLMRLGFYLAEMGLNDLEMFSVLRNADDRWGKFKDRTDRNRRLSDLIARARAKYPTEIQVSEDIVPLYGVVSLLNTEIEIAWIIENLLQEQGYMLLTGPSGVGKTQFSLRVAINLALGRDFLGFKIERPCRILFWSLEMGHSDIKFFISTMCQGMTEEELMTLEENLIIAPLGEAFYLDSVKSQQQFKNIIESLSVDGVFIDSVGSSTSGSISSEETVKTLMDFNDRLRKEMGIFTWYIHHNRKAQGDNKKPNKLSDVYGNQYLVNRATSVYCLWPSGASIEVIPLKKRLAPAEPSWFIQRFGNIDFRKSSNVGLLKGAPEIDLTETNSNPTFGDF